MVLQSHLSSEVTRHVTALNCWTGCTKLLSFLHGYFHFDRFGLCLLLYRYFLVSFVDWPAISFFNFSTQLFFSYYLLNTWRGNQTWARHVPPSIALHFQTVTSKPDSSGDSCGAVGERGLLPFPSRHPLTGEVSCALVFLLFDKQSSWRPEIFYLPAESKLPACSISKFSPFSAQVFAFPKTWQWVYKVFQMLFNGIVAFFLESQVFV